jgi:hypothetical protein
MTKLSESVCTLTWMKYGSTLADLQTEVELVYGKSDVQTILTYLGYLASKQPTVITPININEVRQWLAELTRTHF